MDFTSLGLDDLSKTSHKKNNRMKSLREHIDEVKQISYLLAKNHNLLKFKEIIDLLVDWHDVGKLNPKWNINNDKNPPHSALSAYLYLDNFENLDPMLFYLILKHHSCLNPHDAYPTFSKCREILGKYIIQAVKGMELKIGVSRKNLNITTKKICTALHQLQKKIEDYNLNIVYADLFGIFKTADILSAMFEKDVEIFEEIVHLNRSKVEHNIKGYVNSKGLEFDQNRWKIFCDMANTREDVLFTAPTGWGKTFASIITALNKQPRHVIYVLPTMTSIRKMKNTLSNIFDCRVEENYYFADVEKLREDSHPDLDMFISKSFLSPVTITTLDQIILSFLHVGKYFLKRFHFRDSVFVFDEFHAYPINGLYILLKFIKKFNESFGYGIRSIFMSATSHPDLEKLIEEYTPTSKFEFIREYEKRRRYVYSIESLDIADDESLRSIVKKAESDNVLVLCNTVEKAIKTYLLLKSEYSFKRILLLHSRFTYQDRRNKEDLLEKFSKSKGFVLVSTQVAEVSLDMSFDYLFTEVAPIPSLIQRFGRVNRYSNKTDQINVNIFYPDEIENSKRYPYNKDELKLTFDELIQLEDRIKNELVLIEHFRALPLGLDEAELREIDRYLKKWEKDTRYFFSIDLTDDKLNKLIRFRDTNTALIIPKCFRMTAANILYSNEMYKLQRLKEYLAPVPIWWIVDSLNQSLVDEIENIPILLNPRFQYSHEIGYFDTEKLCEFLDQIEICQEETSIL
ncbi:MAG: CRISPR-associated helicase Cas3' [Candidatus Coatesbacteria bacterium]|nr:MAG: CRISPR-associated helicase Cas3' [Candidatus Coatesbacteria bacterium]